MLKKNPLYFSEAMSVRYRWSFPEDMHCTYAFLFDAARELRVRLAPDLWRLVYNCAAARSREVAWLDTIGYTRRHLLVAENRVQAEYEQRMCDLEENKIALDEQALSEATRRQEKAIRLLKMRIARNRLMSFEPPFFTTDAVSGAPFEVQSDSFYCAVHALNNVARSLLFTPPDMLAAIECTRTLDERCASPEDVMLMALREGVFLLQVSLTHIDDADQLSDGRNFAALLQSAGGMLIYQPSGTGVGTGHYVPLVRVRDQWLIFSGESVLERSPSASAALHAYIASTFDIDVPPGTSAVAARRNAAALSGDDAELPFIGLLPIGLDCLWHKAVADKKNAEGSTVPAAAAGTGESEAVVQKTILARTLLRRSLSEWRLQAANDGAVHEDMWTATPMSPCAIEEIGSIIQYDPQPPTVRCTGLETINVASFIGSRHEVYRELNRYAGRLAHSVMDGRYSVTLDMLRQLRSYLRAPPALDCLFGMDGALAASTDDRTMPGIGVRGNFVSALMSNRRWLRLVALSLVSDAVLTHTEEVEKGALTGHLFRIVVLLGALCYTNMTAYGVTAPPALASVWAGISTPENWQASLPCDNGMPDAIRRTFFGRAGGLASMCSFVSYDATLWLLSSALGLRGFAINGALLDALRMPEGSGADDNRLQFDQKAAFVGALRSTLFRLPLAGVESERVAVTLREQWCFGTPELAQHNRTAANDFIAECDRLFDYEDWRSTATDAIDVFAFHVEYLNNASHERLLLTESDLGRPRFLARAAQSGFVYMHNRSFGRIDSVARAHDRRPALNNAERIDEPQTADVWYTGRVRDTAPRLAVAPLTHLCRLPL